MAKYRKKPIVVDADQWWPGKAVDGVIEESREGLDEHGAPKVFPAHIKTLENWHGVSPGDWIITGVAGEKYPCKPHIFEATYEAEGEWTMTADNCPY